MDERLFSYILLTAWSTCLWGQSVGGKAQAPLATPAPATKIEAFEPSAGSVLTLGYDSFGTVASVSVDAREMRDGKGNSVRGLVVEVTESQYRNERSFIDADEVSELLKGFDALLPVTANPTPFKSFEVRYTTKGELQLTAFNRRDATMNYAVQAGRTLKAEKIGLSTPGGSSLAQRVPPPGKYQ